MSDSMIEQFENYLIQNGVTGSLEDVLSMLCNMDEKPINPLE